MSATLFEQAYAEISRAADSADFPPTFARWRVLERLAHPDRVIRFTVRWLDDDGDVHYTPAWRVQYCNALGPYKGGMRFTREVDEDTLLFLGLEQSLKNALTGLTLGGGKGGAAFRTGDHTENEVLRFCHAFMDEYVRHGGAETDVPAGDIGVGEREIGWLHGRFMKLTGRHAAALTGKPEALGGIPGRIEATGYGVVKFAALMLEARDADLAGKAVAVSGAGNVAIHAARRAVDARARVVSLSDSRGVARFGPDGIEAEALDRIAASLGDGKRLPAALEAEAGAEYVEGAGPWDLGADVALPCATENELDATAARALVDGGVAIVVEGANMPLTADARRVLRDARVPIGPAKAANAGGVTVSGFEMMQNATRDPWTRDDVIARLDDVMTAIHGRCVEEGQSEAGIDYCRGANVAALRRLGEAIVAAGPN